MRISVDFPAPFSPSNPWISPLRSSRFADRRATVLPKTFRSPRTSSRGAAASSAADAVSLMQSPDLLVLRLEVDCGNPEVVARQVTLREDVQRQALRERAERLLPREDAD